MLLIDGIPQSHVDLDDPGYLEFEYVRRLGHVIDTVAPAAQSLRVLHLGAGALTLARYVAATRPGSQQLAVEIDAALIDLVRLRLPLRPTQSGRRSQRAQRGQGGRRGDSGQRDEGGQKVQGGEASDGDSADVGQGGRGRTRPVRIRVGDARVVLEQQPAGFFDVVVTDVFAGGSTPAHLTSVEFAVAVRRVLRGSPVGVFAANVADGAPLAHARAQVATVRAVFPHACLIADATVLRGRRFGNLVLVASTGPLPVDTLTRLAAADPMPGRVLHGYELTRFATGAKPVTDVNARPSPAPPSGAFAS
jgi:spermidine synthase